MPLWRNTLSDLPDKSLKLSDRLRLTTDLFTDRVGQASQLSAAGTCINGHLLLCREIADPCGVGFTGFG